MTMFLSLGAVAGAAVTIANFTGLLDASVVTHTELDTRFEQHESEPHSSAQEQIDKFTRLSQCNTLDIQVAILQEQIWHLEQTQPQSLRLVEKRAELQRLTERRTTLNCSEFA